MSRNTVFPIQNLDRDGNSLNVGDRVGFVMRGWFLPREQESFGLITEIDDHGGIRIEVIENYKHFSTKKRMIERQHAIYFIHHHYDSSRRARVYNKHLGGYDLFIIRINSDELEEKIRNAHNPKSDDPNAKIDLPDPT